MAAMGIHAREGYHGTGPGPLTPDGCAVAHWLRLPAGEEPGIVAAAVPVGTALLELGCGVGRMTHPLLARGFPVTAVDESPQMLEHVRGARTVCSPIETLDLGGERFGAVLLASFLIHNGDPAVRAGMLHACRRHVEDDGCVLIQRHGEEPFRQVPRETRHGDGLVRVLSAEPAGPDVLSVRTEYIYPDARWTHTFLSHRFTAEGFARALAAAGLAPAEALTEDGTWVRVRPA